MPNPTVMDMARGANRWQMAKIALTAGLTNAWAFSWVNPHPQKIVVTGVYVHLTTAGGTGSSVLDIGSGATGTTASDNLIDGQNLNTTGLFNNIEEHGTNGKSKQILDANGGTTTYVNGQILVANASNLVGDVYLEYFIIGA